MAFKQENRWNAHPRAAALLRCGVYAGPVLLAAAASLGAQRALVSSAPGLSAWVMIAATMVVATATLVGAGRLLRRLLPLALLLKLSLLFPDAIPSRFGVALRSASPKRLARRLDSSDDGEAGVAENILALVAALNAHDRRTRGHSERVRAMTMLLADELQLPPADRDRLEWAALLHDLGKMDVPPEILNKRGRPSDREWQILRRHPAGGPARATGIAGWLGEWIHALDQHHERFDGSGYPLGLAGEEIALSGRIVAVADAFEVMTATRSYKRPMSIEAARTELVACAGTHFDPRVVRAFMGVSVGDLHRALGPLSWLTSLPGFSVVGSGLGPAVGNAVLGGTISPALAASLTIVALTPAAANPGPAGDVGGRVTQALFQPALDPSGSDSFVPTPEPIEATGDVDRSSRPGPPTVEPELPEKMVDDDLVDVLDEPITTVTDLVEETTTAATDVIDEPVSERLSSTVGDVVEALDTAASSLDEAVDESGLVAGLDHAGAAVGATVEATVENGPDALTTQLDDAVEAAAGSNPADPLLGDR